MPTSYEDLKSLLNNLQVGIYRSYPGRNGKLIFANTIFLKLFGFKASEITHVSTASLYEGIKLHQVFNQALEREGEVKDFEIKLKKRSGKAFWASVSALAVKD